VIVASLMCSPVAQINFPPLTAAAAFTLRSRTCRLAVRTFFVPDLAMVFSSCCYEVVADYRASAPRASPIPRPDFRQAHEIPDVALRWAAARVERNRRARVPYRYCVEPPYAPPSGDGGPRAVPSKTVELIGVWSPQEACGMIGSRILTIRIPFNWVLSIAAIAVVLITCYVFVGSWRPPLRFIATILAGVGALLTAANALDLRRSSLEQSKKSSALDLSLRYDAPELAHARHAFREIVTHLRDLKSQDEKLAFLKADRSRLDTLLDALNFFETISVAVKNGMADEEMLRTWFDGLLIQSWFASKETVYRLRDLWQRPGLLAEVEWLFDRWSQPSERRSTTQSLI
jgi:hypothetical protein